jgi:U3 small nucleolar RNA-associated protein 25
MVVIRNCQTVFMFLDDYKKMFAGNSDDFFRVGVVIMRKTIKLYTEFYSSDIIIASPVGLRSIIGAEG